MLIIISFVQIGRPEKRTWQCSANRAPPPAGEQWLMGTNMDWDGFERTWAHLCRPVYAYVHSQVFACSVNLFVLFVSFCLISCIWPHLSRPLTSCTEACTLSEHTRIHTWAEQSIQSSSDFWQNRPSTRLAWDSRTHTCGALGAGTEARTQSKKHGNPYVSQTSYALGFRLWAKLAICKASLSKVGHM